MDQKDVLSEAELDALLKKEETEDGVQEDAPVSEPEKVRTVNFSTQDRIIKGQLPVLDKIHDRAMRAFALDIYQITAKDLEIRQEALSIQKAEDCMKALPNPVLMSVYKLRPLRGKALIGFDSTFVYDLVDYYFGGGSRFFTQKERVDFTATELRVMELVMEKLVGNLLDAWKPVIQLHANKIQEESNPQLVQISEPNDMLLMTRFLIDFGQQSGSFYIILPYSMLEPVKQRLELGVTRSDEENDLNWITSLKEELLEVELELRATMAETKSTLKKVLQWQSEDFIPLESDNFVQIAIEGTPEFSATLGTAGDKRAVRIHTRCEKH